jgi:hypothetical protein
MTLLLGSYVRFISPTYLDPKFHRAEFIAPDVKLDKVKKPYVVTNGLTVDVCAVNHRVCRISRPPVTIWMVSNNG